MQLLSRNIAWVVCTTVLGIGCSGSSGTSVPADNSGGASQGGNSSPTSSSSGGADTSSGGSSATGIATNAIGGVAAIGGAVASGGNVTGGAATGGRASTSTGGLMATGGSLAATGGKTAGTTTGGATVAGSKATGGLTSTGGAATGGSKATGGSAATGGFTAGGAATCGATPNPLPFNCQFAWGLNSVSPTTYPYVQFISNWAGYAIQANGTLSSCDQCNWLKTTMASATQVPVLIAYFIGYYGHANGLPDGNLGGPPNLTTGMGSLLLGVANAACPSGVICENNLIVKAYASYAAQVYAVYKKPIIWWLEGDFVQYSPEGAQTQPLSWDQTGQLAAQITRAIKCNDPPALAGWNYSTWISTTQRDQYFGAINSNMAKLGTSWEIVWTSGKGNTTSAGTGTTWDQLSTAAGNKVVMSDESFGASVANDTWSNQTAATINARIGQHVVGIDVTTSSIPTYLQTNVTSTLAPSALNTTCF